MRTNTPMRAIRAKCLECCCGSAAEVRRCTIPHCSLYPYRFGHRPESNLSAETPTFSGGTAANCPEGYMDIPQDERGETRREEPYEPEEK